MSDFMSDFEFLGDAPGEVNDWECINDRATDAEFQQRVDQARQGLEAGLKSATVVKTLASQYGVSHRQARRYTKAARCEMYDAPGSHNELFESMQEHVDHLSRMADAALAEGDKKTSIAASKAAAAVIDRRLAALQREEEFRERMAKQYGC